MMSISTIFAGRAAVPPNLASGSRLPDTCPLIPEVRMVLQSRAIHSEEKASRRADIVAAAGRLLARDPENFASVAQVAEEAGLAKGTVYLYFKTKEEMLMALHGEHAMAMFDGMDAALSLPRERVTPELIADGFVAFVRSNPLFLHTAAICHSSLGRNIDPDLLLEHQKSIAMRLARSGSLLLARFPEFAARGPMAGMDFLHHAFSYAIGTWQLCDPRHVQMCSPGQSLADLPPEMNVFVRDVYADLRVGLLALWYGMAGNLPRSTQE